MKATTIAVVATLLCSASASQANPLQKVVQLLSDLEAKIKADGEKEVAAYEKYAAWCKSDAQEKGFEIQTATSQLEATSAKIPKAAADIEVATSRIEDLAAGIAADEGDLKDATDIRTKAHTDFVALEGELVDTIGTLDRALKVLERKGSALLQKGVSSDISQMLQALEVVLDAASVSVEDKKKLLALAQTAGGAADGEDGVNAPAAGVYNSHGGSILDLLEDLREKAATDLDKARKAETASIQNFDLSKQALENHVAVQEKELQTTKAAKAAAAEVKATAESDVAVTRKDLAATKEALEALNTACATAAADHEASMKGRSEELEALASAKQAIQDKTGAAEGVAYSSLFQAECKAHTAGSEVVDAVRQAAQRTNSKALAQLAHRIRAVISHSDNPFGKVKGLIQSLLERLEKEAGEAFDHKEFCDRETARAQEKIAGLQQTTDKLTAKSDTQKADSERLKGEVAELFRELRDLADSQVKMDAARKEEAAVYAQTKADLEQGLEGVRLALKVLREHFGSFVQQPALPTYHSKSTGAVSGIIGMLEVIESDLGKNLAEVNDEEEDTIEAYNKLTQENKVTKTSKEQDVKYKQSEAATRDKSVGELSSDLESTQTELAAALEAAKSLREQCVEKPESYEERRVKREAEIAGLKQALEILESQAALLQGVSVRRHQ